MIIGSITENKEIEKRIAVTPDIVSVITAVMATHLGKSPQELHITEINTK